LTAGEIGVLSVSFLFFDVGESVCGCMCVYSHTHTHTAHGVLGCEPKGRYEAPGGPDESRWITSWYIFVYVYKVHMPGDRMRSWTNCFFSLTCFFSRRRQAKDVNIIPISQIQKDLNA